MRLAVHPSKGHRLRVFVRGREPRRWVVGDPFYGGVMTCTSLPTCRIAKGARHLPTCPRYGTRSGPSGKGLQPRSNVDTAKLEALRAALSLRADATPNQILDAATEFVMSPRM
jgi:hypothetical protein